MFEKHRPPAVFMAKNAVLSSFATGRQTSVVVDIGHEGTTGAAEDYCRLSSVVERWIYPPAYLSIVCCWPPCCNVSYLADWWRPLLLGGVPLCYS